MKRKLSGREKLLLGVFGIAAVILVRNWMGQPLVPRSGAAEEAERDRGFGDPPVVQLAMLELGAADFDPQGRNLFDYYTPPRQPKKAAKKVARKPAPKPTRKVDPPPPPAPRKPKPPTPTFRYLGHVGPKENLIGAFQADGPVHVVRVGGVIERDFKLLEFKYDSVVLGYVDEKWEGQTAELKMSER